MFKSVFTGNLEKTSETSAPTIKKIHKLKIIDKHNKCLSHFIPIATTENEYFM